MVRKLKRIAPVKFGLVIGIVYGILSLLFIPFFGLMMMISLLAPHSGNSNPLAAGIGIATALIFMVLAPFLYAAMGFIFGALGALIYNLAAKWTGGIEFEVE